MQTKLKKLQKIQRILYENGIGVTTARAIIIAKALDEKKDIKSILRKFTKNEKIIEKIYKEIICIKE